MITEKEIPTVLAEKIPEIKNELEKNMVNIFKVLNCFKSYTIRCAELGKIDKLRSCFVIAEKFLRDGNNDVKSEMENVYVNSVSSLIEIYSPIQEPVKKILPENLKKACLKHIADLYSYDDRKDENCLYQNERIKLQNKFYPV